MTSLKWLVNPLCWMFDYQVPWFIWNHETLGQIFYRLHLNTCLIMFACKKDWRKCLSPLRDPRDKFPEKTLLDKFLSEINHYTFTWFGFCLQCYRFTLNLHDDSDVGYHCRNCCEKIYPNDSYLWREDDMDMPRTISIKRTCAVCGKEFLVLLDENGKILGGGRYYGTMRFGIGNWAISRAVTNEDGSLKHDKDGFILWERCIPRWKELKYRLIDFKRKLLHQYEDIEYWEDDECVRKSAWKYRARK